jgi:DNA-directed RNA polymerase specialized sigma24 family protein
LISSEALFRESLDASRIRVLVAKLPRLQRDIVIRRFWGPDSISEIAEALGLDFDDVLALLKMALKKLQEEFGSLSYA